MLIGFRMDTGVPTAVPDAHTDPSAFAAKLSELLLWPPTAFCLFVSTNVAKETKEKNGSLSRIML